MSYEFELVTSEAQLDALSEEWEALWRGSPNATIFLSFDWVMMSWRRVALRDPQSPRIAVVRDAGQMVGAFPLMRRRRLGLFVEDWGLAPNMPQYNDALLLKDADQGGTVDALIDGLFRTGRPYRLCLDRTPETSPLYKRLVARGARTKVISPAAGVDLRHGHDAYQTGLDTFFKSDHRRRLRRMGEMGRIDFRLSRASTLDADLDWLLLHKRLWKPPNGGKLRPWVNALDSENDLRQVAHTQLTKSQLWFGLLTLDESRVAGSMYFLGPQGLLAYVITHDRRFDKFSPGRSLNLRIVEEAAKAGLPLLDFMGGDADWKDRLANWHCNINYVRYRQ